MAHSGFATKKDSSASRTGNTSLNNSSVSNTTGSSFGAPGPVTTGSFAIQRYNTNERKSEIAEMKETLTKAINDRNEAGKTEIIKKIIAAMTAGMDVSDLFQNIIMVSNTQDLLLKKMIYLYLGHYSKENEHMALLAVNSIVKDTHDDSPMVRGMALRWLSSLSAPTLVEHMLVPVKNGLIDISAYVRRNAALACCKVNRINPEVFTRDRGIVNKLYELIRDKDPFVVINSLCALEEILQTEGGVALNQPIVFHLLSHLGEFNNWGQHFVLKLLSRYQISDEEELIKLMNGLDTFFEKSNPTVILAVSHCFLTFTQTHPDIHKHVYMRIKDPLLSVLVGVGPELAYTILSHVILLTKRIPNLFNNEYRQFYVKFKDPLYLRLLKVRVLQATANEINSKEIVNELSSYALEDQPDFSRESIRAIGKLAMRIPAVSELALEILLSFLEMEQLQHVLATTLITLKDMLRRFPQIAQDVIPRLAHTLDVVEESNAVMAIITMIGEYGDIISDGPYILEEVINSWSKKDEKVKNQLLVSTLKLFFKRPKEVKPILGKLFKVSCEDDLHPDVHDRAIFFYRLLSSNRGANIEKCKKILLSGSTYVEQFVEELDGFEVDRLFEEFDSLTVIYQEVPERFLKTNGNFLEEVNIQEQRRKAEEEEEYYRKKREEEIRETYEQEEEMNRQNPSNYTAPHVSPFENGLSSGTLQFNPAALLDPPTFERTWRSLTYFKTYNANYTGRSTDPSAIDQFFNGKQIKSVAKGATGPVLRFFLYAQETNSAALFMVELIINLQQRTISANIKSTHENFIPEFETTFASILQQL